MKLFTGLLFLLSLLCASPARADTPIVLYKSYAGNLNFVGTQKSMRTQSNSANACSINTGAISATLSGIPTGATVVAAHLYWAGSSSTNDYTVTFEGTSITAPVGSPGTELEFAL